MKVYLERIVPASRMARFYVIVVQANLLGEWTVVREWGRIGWGGTVRDTPHISEAIAIEIADRLTTSKLRRGYRTRV